MFNGPMFIRLNRYRRYASKMGNSGAWWAIAGPGALLIVVALVMMIFPQLLIYLLAYAVATVLLVSGISLVAWGWSMRRITQQGGTGRFGRQQERSPRDEVWEAESEDGVRYRVQ